MKRQAGFGAIAAIVVLVLLAALAAAVVSLSSTQAMTVAQDALAARADQSARSGLETGLQRALGGAATWTGGSCDTAAVTLDMTPPNGTPVTVSCASAQYNEGLDAAGAVQTVRVYRVRAIACSPANASGQCPNNAGAAAPGYVERVREAVVVR